jgi:Tfp pilus assembly protein PilF
VQVFPTSSNAYDSLAEAYMKSGQKQLAIDNYKKSLELDPDNDNAKEKLKTLEAAPTR